jgi:hypothetical protein
LAVSYVFTANFFSTKLRQLLRLPPPHTYNQDPMLPGWWWMSFAIFKYLSSVTLIIRPIHHDVGSRIRAEKSARLPETQAAAA